MSQIEAAAGLEAGTELRKVCAARALFPHLQECSEDDALVVCPDAVGQVQMGIGALCWRAKRVIRQPIDDERQGLGDLHTHYTGTRVERGILSNHSRRIEPPPGLNG